MLANQFTPLRTLPSAGYTAWLDTNPRADISAYPPTLHTKWLLTAPSTLYNNRDCRARSRTGFRCFLFYDSRAPGYKFMKPERPVGIAIGAVTSGREFIIPGGNWVRLFDLTASRCVTTSLGAHLKSQPGIESDC